MLVLFALLPVWGRVVGLFVCFLKVSIKVCAWYVLSETSVQEYGFVYSRTQAKTALKLVCFSSWQMLYVTV